MAASASRTLIVPLGATEQHGPHLPLDTDTRIATAWSEELGRRLDDAVVAPTLPYGSSGEHQSFVGTLSIGQEALHHVVVELVRSAGHHFERVILVSGHAGNAQPLMSAVEQLQLEGHDVTALLPRIDGADAHAGHTETSLMLALAPEQVRTELVEAGCTLPLAEIIDILRSGGVAAVAPNGVLGDPRSATATDGAEIFERLAASSPSDRPDC